MRRLEKKWKHLYFYASPCFLFSISRKKTICFRWCHYKWCPGRIISVHLLTLKGPKQQLYSCTSKSMTSVQDWNATAARLHDNPLNLESNLSGETTTQHPLLQPHGNYLQSLSWATKPQHTPSVQTSFHGTFQRPYRCVVWIRNPNLLGAVVRNPLEKELTIWTQTVLDARFPFPGR